MCKEIRRTIRKTGKVVPRAEERKKERIRARGSCGEALRKREVREKMCYGFYSDLGVEEGEPEWKLGHIYRIKLFS